MAKRIRKTMLIIAAIGAVLMTVSGCWDAVDIEKRDICTTVLLDKQGDDFVIFTEIATITSKIQNPETEQAGGLQAPRATIVKGSGKTIPEARVNLDRELNKPLYLGAVQALVMTERMAEYGIEEYVMRLRQLIEYRKTMDIIVTPDEPDEFFSILPENESSVGFAVESTVENLRKEGVTYHMSLADLLQKHSSKNTCYLLNAVSCKTEQVYPIGNMVMDDGKKIGFIPNEESQGIVCLAKKHGKIKFDDQIDVDGKKIAAEITMKRRSIKPSYNGDKATFKIDVGFDARILYPAENVPVTPGTEQKTEYVLKERLTKMLKDTVDKSQKEYGCDYLSFSEDFRIAYSDVYEQKDWREIFQKADFNVSVAVNVLESKDITYDTKPII